MRVVLAISIVLLMGVHTNAETIVLSELDDETRVYIQRGNHGHNVECYEYVLSHVLGPKADLSQYAVTFDDPSVNGIGVGSVDSGEYYSCENGELRSWDGGESILMKRF